VLDERSVLVVDEAGMLGSRKLARLLDYAAEARSKIVLVGDDKQLAAIEAGGGFRGLRLRLGASTLTENRRQAEPWEREASSTYATATLTPPSLRIGRMSGWSPSRPQGSSRRRCWQTGGSRSSTATAW
jgi:AAA domain